MRKQVVRTILVSVEKKRHDILERDGFCVVIYLNGHPTVSEFKFSEEEANKRAKVLRNRPIPKGATLGYLAGTWVPLTSCNPLFNSSTGKELA